MTNQTQEHKDDNITVEVTREAGCLVTFSISVSPEMVKKEYNSAVKATNKQVSLPGFRKGRAPTDMIIKHYKPHIEKEWKNSVLDQAFREGLKLANIYPLNQQSIKKADLKNCSIEEGASAIVQFESSPDIPDVDFTSIELEKVEAEPVSEKKIEQIIEDIRYQFAEWEEVTDRAVEEKDFVDVDIENLDEPGVFLCQDTRLEMEKGKMGTWLYELLLGMSIGDSKEAMSSLDEGQDVPEFKPTNCKVTAKAIAKSILPEVDQALADKAGVKDVEELRSRVVNDLEKLHEQQAQDKRRQNLIKALVEKHPFDVPDSIVNPHVQDVIVERTKELKESTPEGEEISKEKIDEIEQSTRKEVENLYRWHFFVSKIADEKNIEVNQEEVTREMMSHLYRMYEQGIKPDPNEDQEERLRKVHSQLIAREVADFLIKETS